MRAKGVEEIAGRSYFLDLPQGLMRMLPLLPLLPWRPLLLVHLLLSLLLLLQLRWENFELTP